MTESDNATSPQEDVVTQVSANLEKWSSSLTGAAFGASSGYGLRETFENILSPVFRAMDQGQLSIDEKQMFAAITAEVVMGVTGAVVGLRHARNAQKITAMKDELETYIPATLKRHRENDINGADRVVSDATIGAIVGGVAGDTLYVQLADAIQYITEKMPYAGSAPHIHAAMVLVAATAGLSAGVSVAKRHVELDGLKSDVKHARKFGTPAQSHVEAATQTEEAQTGRQK